MKYVRLLVVFNNIVKIVKDALPEAKHYVGLAETEFDMKIAWCSDLHLDHLRLDWTDKPIPGALAKFGKQLREADSDITVVSGDIATATNLSSIIEILAHESNKPFLFCLGNHDFWGSSFYAVHEEIRRLSNKNPNIKWVQEYHFEVNDETIITGCDGWYDARCGNPFWGIGLGNKHYFELNDFEEIEKYAVSAHGRDTIIAMCNNLGDASARKARGNIESFVSKYRKIIFVTHVPPFAAASLFHGNPSPVYSVPFFVNRVLGDTLLEIKEKFPDNDFMVLCGHAHDKAELTIDNLKILTAPAKYADPMIYKIIEI